MNLIEMRREHYDEMLAAARGDIPVDTLIHGGRILNVLTGEILKGDIAIHSRFIARHRLGANLVLASACSQAINATLSPLMRYAKWVRMYIGQPDSTSSVPMVCRSFSCRTGTTPKGDLTLIPADATWESRASISCWPCCLTPSQ